MSHLGSLGGGTPKVTLKPLLGHFNSFCVSVELGGHPLHNSKRCFSEWCVQRVVRNREDRRHQNSLKHWCFKAFFLPLKGCSSVASRGDEPEKHHVKTPFGTLRIEKKHPKTKPNESNTKQTTQNNKNTKKKPNKHCKVVGPLLAPKLFCLHFEPILWCLCGVKKHPFRKTNSNIENSKSPSA